jgi:hypothetical protein
MFRNLSHGLQCKGGRMTLSEKKKGGRLCRPSFK